MKGDGSVDPGQLAGRVASVLPKGYESITAATAASQQQDQVSTGLGFLRTFFLIFGFVALFVGAFIIFNMFNIVVSQRSRELALFRALGASRRQVLTSVLLEALAVGLIGSIVGIGFGVLLAFALKALSRPRTEAATDRARDRDQDGRRVPDRRIGITVLPRGRRRVAPRGWLRSRRSARARRRARR